MIFFIYYSLFHSPLIDIYPLSPKTRLGRKQDETNIKQNNVSLPYRETRQVSCECVIIWLQSQACLDSASKERLSGNTLYHPL